MSAPFAHLHFHTQYSISEGAVRIAGLGRTLREKNVSACAITDHGNLHGIVEFHDELKANGVKPIIGQGFRTHSLAREGNKGGRLYTLNLLATDRRGYLNLIKLSSLSYEREQDGGPSISRELLREYSEGLIATGGGSESEIEHALAAGNPNQAEAVAQFLKATFHERCYLEIRRTGEDDQERTIARLSEFSLARDVPLVATNPCFYLEKEDCFAQHVLKLMGRQTTLEDNSLPRLPDGYRLKSAGEMHAEFADFPEAIANAERIADSCRVDLKCDEHYLPEFETASGITLEEQIRQDASEGLERKLALLPAKTGDGENEKSRQTYRDRLDSELKVIVDMNYAGYFLVVADFVNWSKRNGVVVGPGRGSGAGSLVAFCLGITDVDPIRYDLLFERFLNPARISMPDFDVDFDNKGRERTIEYVRDKYGEKKVCKISAIGSLQAKAALKGVARVLGFSVGQGDRLAKMVPRDLNITLEKALEKSPELRQIQLEGSDEEKRLIEIALRLEGLNSNLSTHAAGVIIMNRDVSDVIPVCRNASDGFIQSQLTMEDAEKQGAVKFDFLGLKNLSILDEAVKMIKANRPGNDFDLDSVSLDDPEALKLLSRGQTLGIFQMESEGMTRLLKNLKPDRFEDIVAAVALYRPGPLGAKMDQTFVERKHGRQIAEYPDERTKVFLEETYGVMVYQEQVMRMAQVMAGFTLGEADLLRRAMGKKKEDLLKEQEDKFLEGCLRLGTEKAKAEEIFRLILYFAGYGFNKSHSVSYAVIALKTAYLKARFPIEFMVAVMNLEKDADKVVKLLREAVETGIGILPPDVNRSGEKFTVEEGKIRYGMGVIKNVGADAFEAVRKIREREGEFQTMEGFYEACESTGLDSRMYETLIKSGAFDSINANRRQIFATHAEKRREIQAFLASKIEDNFTLFTNHAPEPPTVESTKEKEDWPFLERLAYEKEMLGFYASAHPLDFFDRFFAGNGNPSDASSMNLKKLKDLAEKKSSESARSFPSENHRQPFRRKNGYSAPETRVLPAVVSRVDVRLDKNNRRYAFVELEDGTSWIEAMLNTETFAAAEAFLEPPSLVSASLGFRSFDGKLRYHCEALEPLVRKRLNRSPCFLVDLGNEKGSEALGELKRLLDGFPGETPVQIRARYGSGLSVEFDPGIKVRLDEAFLERAENAFPGRVRWVEKKG